MAFQPGAPDGTMRRSRRTRGPRQGVRRACWWRRGRSAAAVRGVGMDQLREFLTVVRREGAARGELLGLLHILIGRRLTTADGAEVSRGLSWRALAALLKQARWEPED